MARSMPADGSLHSRPPRAARAFGDRTGLIHALYEARLEAVRPGPPPLRIPGLPEPAFTAHALLAAIRADLVEHLAGHEGTPREAHRAHLATFTARVLNGPVP
ncbi:hypothetical protein ACFXPN_15540 [Streptomyces griseorubiginosus]|uniref:hypothetical protein n=1 Tax=Streptomyces griseorubiginosus TaxID=67304 RepID=UPI0036C7F138